MPRSASIDKDEVAQFSAHAGDWWNPDGAMRPLHRLNPVRLQYIREQILGHFAKAPKKGQGAYSGLSILDIGCGGGILCEPFARLGAKVTGLDASVEAIAAAKAHAKQSGLNISYECDSAENFAASGKKFDVITALEILEHVADMNSLLSAVAKMLKPNGLAIFSTVNRTPKSYLLGIVVAEYLLKWVPRGTHDWRKFIRPSELAAHLSKAGLTVSDIRGMKFDPLDNDFYLQTDEASVNYLMSAVKA